MKRGQNRPYVEEPKKGLDKWLATGSEPKTHQKSQGKERERRLKGKGFCFME